MKTTYFGKKLVLLYAFIALCGAAEAQEKKIFSIAPSFSFAWYPMSNIQNTESTNTEVDISNFGMSAIMSLKLFKKVGTYLNLNIDDPTFKRLVDIAGFVTAYYFLLKFDYHSFGGTVTWTGNTPNPIPDEVYNFRNQWINASLLFRIDQLKPKNEGLTRLLHIFKAYGPDTLTAIGIGYFNFDMPVEYRIRSGNELSNPGFGLIKGSVWGISMLYDTFTWNMERPSSNVFADLWLSVDSFWGFIGKAETDPQAIAWMSNANNGVSFDDSITRLFCLRGNMDLGLQHIWNVRKVRIGLGIGLETLFEGISAFNDDIDIDFFSANMGPVVRLSICW